jgi:5-formyltetrahydrofolate cyclo-ligase
MTDSAIEEAKADLRIKARARRAALSEPFRIEAAQAAGRNFFDAVPLREGAVVAGYWRIRDEMDCQPILIRLMDSGQPVCLPVVTGDDEPLVMRLWEEGAALYPSGFGTLAPSELAPAVEPDVIVVPLLGFDASGTRLGYGGGYYDRTLARMLKRPLLVGLAFSAQRIGRIPREPHDVPLDYIVTETGATRFRKDTV